MKGVFHMKKEQNARPLNKNNPTMDEDYLYSASCRDCTGLAPTPAHDEFEAESYEELYHYLPPVLPPNSASAVDDPIPPITHGRSADGIHLEMRREVTDQPEENKKYYP